MEFPLLASEGNTHTGTQTHRHRHTHTHRDTNTHTYKHRYTHTHTHTHTQSYRHIHTYTHTHRVMFGPGSGTIWRYCLVGLGVSCGHGLKTFVLAAWKHVFT